jgi:tetratricopeptide (TPR) repeat protein
MQKRTSIPVFGLLLLASAPAHADWEAGVAAFKAKNYAQAQKEFEGVVRERPDWSGGFLMLGRSLLLAQKVGEATNALRKAYDLDPSDLEVQLALSQAYLESNRAAEAYQLLSKVNPAGVPKERQALFQQLQAKAAAESGQSERAVAALEKAAAANPNDATVQFNYGIAALNAGNVAAAAGALERSVRLDPSDLEKQKLLVQTLLRQGREAQGPAKDPIYGRAAEVARGMVGKSPSYEHTLLLGEAQLGASQYDAAIGSFGQATAKNAGDWLPYFYVGQAQTALARYGEAEAALRRAQERAAAAADKARIWRQLGFIYEKQRSFEQAKAAYRNAGDSGSVARVEQNEEIAKHNLAAEEEAKKLAELKAQQERLRQQMQQTTPPPD